MAALTLSLLGALPASAQSVAVFGKPTTTPRSGAAFGAPAGLTPTPLTLDEAVQRALASNKSLHLAMLLVEEKQHVTRQNQSTYLPKVAALGLYQHFDKFLGSVITGPLGNTNSVPIFSQDGRFGALYVAQPLTPLLKVRQGVKIARADEQLAHIQVEKARRELRAGVEQLYFGLLAAQRIQEQAAMALAATAKLAQAVNTPEARLAMLQARQGTQAATKEVADVTEQLNSLLELPLCTPLLPTEPPPLTAPVKCVDEAMQHALATSPEVQEALQNIAKAEAAVRLGKLAYVPDVSVMGFSAAQDVMPSVQNGFSGVAVVASVSLYEGGKRRSVLRQYQTQLSMANGSLNVARDKVRLSAQKAYREFVESGEAAATAAEVLALRREAVKSAREPAAQRAALEALMRAQIDSIKAELGQRQAYSQLLRVMGR